MSQSMVHRPLIEGRTRGPDVAAFQRATNAIFNHYKIDYRLAVDGIYGRKSHLAGRRAARIMGITAVAWGKMVQGRMPMGAQKLVRQQRRRTTAERQAAKRRVTYRKAVRTVYAKPPGPKIYTGIVSPSDFFGPIGPVTDLTGHYTGGTPDTSDAHAIALCRSHDAYHRSLGWGGYAYHWCITREGNIICGRPTGWKGAHTALHNSGNLGIVMHGTTGTRPNAAQAATLRWLLAYAHTGRMPAAHRAPRKIEGLRLRGHFEWPDNSTSCPGDFIDLYRSKGAKL